MQRFYSYPNVSAVLEQTHLLDLFQDILVHWFGLYMTTSIVSKLQFSTLKFVSQADKWW